MDKVRIFLRELCGALASARMFPVEHPQFRNVLVKAHNSLDEILKQKEELIIGIVEEELIYGKEVLSELTTLLKFFITAAQKKGIEKIHFMRGVKEEELVNFLSFLISKKEISGNIQDYFSVRGIHYIRVSKLTTPLDEKKKEFVSEVQIYENTIKELSDQIEKIINQKPTSNIYMDLKFIIFSVLENFSGHYGEFSLLYQDKGFDKDIAHSFNTATLSVQFAQGLGFLQEEILEIGIAALLHDIGRVYLTRSKNGSLQPGNKATLIPGHAILGMNILLKYEEFFGNLPVIVAGECYLKLGQNQICGGLISLKSHIVSQIVGVSAYYDTLHINSNRQEGYAPVMIYEDMHVKQDQFWPSALLGEFFKTLGVWPTGSIVALDDGSVAIIREQNRRDIFTPKIEVIHPWERKGFVDLKKHTAAINKFLNPLAQGQPYLKYI